VVSSVLQEGQLLKPGDTLMDGTKLANRLTKGSEDRIGLYTSPSIKYCELDIYAKPCRWAGRSVRMVLQCRQKPGSFSPAGETIDWKGRFGNAPISTHFGNDEIERFTRAGGSIIPYRILIGLDVVTREDELAKLENLRKRVADAEKVLHDARIAQAKAHQAKLEAERALQKHVLLEQNAEMAKNAAERQVEKERQALAWEQLKAQLKGGV